MSNSEILARYFLDAIEDPEFDPDESRVSGILVRDSFEADAGKSSFVVETGDGYFRVEISEVAIEDIEGEG